MVRPVNTCQHPSSRAHARFAPLQPPTLEARFGGLRAEGNADALVLAVHWNRVDDVLREAGDLTGMVLVTCSLPMSDDDTELIIAHTSSGAEELARKTLGARLVSGFGTVLSEVLFPAFEDRCRAPRPALLHSGNGDDAKERTAGLIRDVGFEPVDAGPLQMARYSEPFTMLMARLAYEGDRGPDVAYRFE